MSLLPIRGNALGLAMIVATGLIAGVGGFVFKLNDAVVMIAVGSALIGMDLILRLRYWQVKGWLTQSQLGGYFFFVPVWVLGSVVIVINVINALT